MPGPPQGPGSPCPHGLSGWPPLYNYVTRSIHDIGSLYLELLPASLLIPFIPWPWRRTNKAGDIPPVVAPMILYSGVCTAILVWWPGFNTRYAMPIAPSIICAMNPTRINRTMLCSITFPLLRVATIG